MLPFMGEEGEELIFFIGELKKVSIYHSLEGKCLKKVGN